MINEYMKYEKKFKVLEKRGNTDSSKYSILKKKAENKLFDIKKEQYYFFQQNQQDLFTGEAFVVYLNEIDAQ